MKTLLGWRRISNQGSFQNETTGQTLVVAKAEFGSHYRVMLFEGRYKEKEGGEKLSPEYPNEMKAEAFAIDWMTKNPKGKN